MRKTIGEVSVSVNGMRCLRDQFAEWHHCVVDGVNTFGLAAYRVPTSVGLFLGSKNPTKVGTLYAVVQGTDLIVMSADDNQRKELFYGARRRRHWRDIYRFCF